MTKCPVYNVQTNNCKKLVFTMLLFLFTNSLYVTYINQKSIKSLKIDSFLIRMNLTTCTQMSGLFCPLLYEY